MRKLPLNRVELTYLSIWNGGMQNQIHIHKYSYQVILHQTFLLLTPDFGWSAPPEKPYYGPDPAGHTMLSPSIQINEI